MSSPPATGPRARTSPARATFFVSATGNQVTAATVGTVFGRIWDQAGLARPAGGQQPRPYDFRHHFAYANIERWMSEGKRRRLRCCPTCLATWATRPFDSTYYYIHTSPDFMDAYAEITQDSQSLLPEVGIRMRRDPATGAPDFFSFARDYLHAYMPKVRGLSPKTIEAYRISLECFLDYLAEAEHIGREHVSFDHFDRQHLKGMAGLDDRSAALHAEDRRAAPQRRQSVPGLRRPRRHHPRRAQPGSQGPQSAGQPQQARSSTSPNPKPGRSLPRSPGRQRNPAGTGCCSSCSTTPPPAWARSPA